MMITSVQPGHGPVVVAIGDHDESAAIEYAVRAAQHRGAALHLVHSVEVASSPTAGPQRHDVLARAAQRAHALADALPGRPVEVTGEVSTLGPVAALLAVADGASLVVVGRRATPRPMHPYVRTVTGSLGSRLAAPVVTVPDEWSPGRAHERVVVGIGGPEPCEEVLAAALAAAEAHGVRLLALCSQWSPDARPPLVDEAGLRDELGDTLDGLRSAAGVEVEVEVQIGTAHPGEALLEASRDAALLVLGRRTSPLPSGCHLGPMPSAVLREAACPVLLCTPAHPAWTAHIA